jgi:hypothetical protein
MSIYHLKSIIEYCAHFYFVNEIFFMQQSSTISIEQESLPVTNSDNSTEINLNAIHKVR